MIPENQRPVFIMCAGKETRMNGALPYPKAFIRVNGEPLIKRTLRLLRELDHGKPWDERFAIVADASFFGGWALKSSLKDIPDSVIRKVSVPLGDFTEDFDFPHELETVLPKVERLALQER